VACEGPSATTHVPRERGSLRIVGEAGGGRCRFAETRNVSVPYPGKGEGRSNEGGGFQKFIRPTVSTGGSTLIGMGGNDKNTRGKSKATGAFLRAWGEEASGEKKEGGREESNVLTLVVGRGKANGLEQYRHPTGMVARMGAGGKERFGIRIKR